MILDSAPGDELPQRPFLRITIRTTSKIKPPTIHASSHVIGHLPLVAAFRCGKSAIAIVRDWETHEKSRGVSTPIDLKTFLPHSPSSFTYSYSTTDFSFTYGADAELNSAKCRDFRCTSKAARFL